MRIKTDFLAASTILGSVLASNVARAGGNGEEKPMVTHAAADVPYIFSPNTYIPGEARGDFPQGLALSMNALPQFSAAGGAPRVDFEHRCFYQGRHHASIITGGSGDIIYDFKENPDGTVPNFRFEIENAFITSDVQLKYPEGYNPLSTDTVFVTATLTKISAENPDSVQQARKAILKSGDRYTGALDQVGELERQELSERLDTHINGKSRKKTFNSEKFEFIAAGAWTRGLVAPVFENEEGNFIVWGDIDTDKISLPGAPLQTQRLDTIVLDRHPLVLMKQNIVENPDGTYTLQAEARSTNTHEAVYAHGQSGFLGKAFWDANPSAFPANTNQVEVKNIQILALGPSAMGDLPYDYSVTLCPIYTSAPEADLAFIGDARNANPGNVKINLTGPGLD